MYIVIVQETNTRGPEDPVEEREANTLDEAISIFDTFANQYLSDPGNQYTITIIPTSIY